MTAVKTGVIDFFPVSAILNSNSCFSNSDYVFTSRMFIHACSLGRRCGIEFFMATLKMTSTITTPVLIPRLTFIVLVTVLATAFYSKLVLKCNRTYACLLNWDFYYNQVAVNTATFIKWSNAGVSAAYLLFNLINIIRKVTCWSGC